jgi:hypothetical protein
MRLQPLIARVVTGSFALFTVFLVAFWIGTAWFGLYRVGNNWAVGLDAGRVVVLRQYPTEIIWGSAGATGPFSTPSLGRTTGWCVTRQPIYVSWGLRSAGSFPGAPWRSATPLWMLIVPALLATMAAGRWSKATRRKANLCLKCDYDRSGLPAGAKCPECGFPGT